jgi:hypothetical protein
MDPIVEYATDTDRLKKEDEDKRRTLAISRVRDILETQGFSEIINLVLDISNFNGNNYSNDIKDMVYMEGRRSVCLDLLGFLEDCDPTYYARLLLKRAEDERLKNERRNNDDT